MPCLIRRLKERVETAKGELCVVGTSATLDDREHTRDASAGRIDGSIDARETSSDRLARFAGTLFDEDIQSDAVIGEDRFTVEEIILPDVEDVTIPKAADYESRDDEDSLHFVLRQAKLWGGPEYNRTEIPPYLFSKDEEKLTDADKEIMREVESWSVELGAWVKRNRLFAYLLNIFSCAEENKNGPLTWNDVIERLTREEFGVKDYPKFDDRNAICASFFALVAQAKERRSGTPFSLVPTQVQLWIRELRRLGRLV